MNAHPLLTLAIASVFAVTAAVARVLTGRRRPCPPDCPDCTTP